MNNYIYTHIYVYIFICEYKRFNVNSDISVRNNLKHLRSIRWVEEKDDLKVLARVRVHVRVYVHFARLLEVQMLSNLVSDKRRKN